MKNKTGQRKCQEKLDISRVKSIADLALWDDKRLFLKQVSDLLSDPGMNARMQGRSILLDAVMDRSCKGAEKMLFEGCRKALASEDLDERKDGRKILIRLTLKKDRAEAKRMLLGDYKKAIDDFDTYALLFLGLYGRGRVEDEAISALKSNIDRLEREKGFDALSYLAVILDCSPQTKIRAASIVAERSSRKGELEFMHQTTDSPDVRSIVGQAMDRRR